MSGVSTVSNLNKLLTLVFVLLRKVEVQFPQILKYQTVLVTGY